MSTVQKNPGTVVDDNAVGTITWSDPSYAATSDDKYATAYLVAKGGTQYTHYLKCTNFGFSIPSGCIITGIAVYIEKKASGSGTKQNVRDYQVSLLKGGVVTGNNKADTATDWPTSDTSIYYGYTLDYWGITLTPDDVNASDFGVVLEAKLYSNTNNGAALTAYVDAVSVTVYYQREFQQGTEDGAIELSGTSWPPTTANVYTSTAYYAVQCNNDSGTYYIDRIYLRFDTSSIPDDNTVRSAKLWLKLYAKYNYNNFKIETQVYKASSDWNPLDAGDWGCGSALVATKAYDSLPNPGDWLYFDLPTDCINKTGITAFELRGNHESGDPPGGANQVAFYSANSNDNEPYLEIVHSYSENFTQSVIDLNALFDKQPSFTVLGNPNTTPDYAYSCAFSPDGTYLAVGQNAQPCVYVYKRSEDTYTKLDNLDAPVYNGYGCDFSPDGTYLAVAASNSPYILIYKRSGDTFTRLTDPSNLPAGTANGCAFSPDGNYLAVAHNNSPFITVYKRSGDIFTKLSSPSDYPPGDANDCVFSPDSNYLAVAHYYSPFITVYKRSGDIFTKLSSPSDYPPSIGYGCDFSPDGLFLAVACGSSPGIVIYKRSGDTFNKVSAPQVAALGMRCNFSRDGIYLAIANYYYSPYAAILQRCGDTFILTDYPGNSPSYVRDCMFSPDSAHFIIVRDTTPSMKLYRAFSSLCFTSLGFSRPISDGVLTSDTITPELILGGLVRDLLEAVAIADTIESIAAYDRVLSDPVTISEIISRTGEYMRDFMDNLILEDSGKVISQVSYLKDFINNSGISDFTISLQEYVREISDVIGISDEVILQLVMLRVIMDYVSISDEVLRELVKRIIARSGLGLSNPMIF